MSRGLEPAGLAHNRQHVIPTAKDKVDAGIALERDDIDGYQVAKQALWQAQHQKCAYCESWLPWKYAPVEHYRPALKANRGPGFPIYGYWWLALTWENLLFACSICNTSHKGYKFPLEAGSGVLVAPEAPPGTEVTVLVDPADPSDPDPMDLIAYEPVNINRWVPTGRNSDKRGATIVETLGLHDPAHLDRYAEHVNENLMPHIEGVLKALERSQRDDLDREWEHLVRFARPCRPWSGLSFDVIDYFVPEDIRSSWGLVLDRP